MHILIFMAVLQDNFADPVSETISSF